MKIKVVDFELSCPLETIEGLGDYTALKGLVRLYGTPIGYIQLPVINSRCTASAIRKAILEQHSWGIIRYHIHNCLMAPHRQERSKADNLFDIEPSDYYGHWPPVTVAVCTRDRTEDLGLWLNALMNIDYPNLEILVIDNAPCSTATKRLVKENFPAFRYICEPRPGLDWARNRAIIESHGEIIAYTDDDVVVDSRWVKALVRPFLDDATVMAVTGLVIPYELETEAQILFEQYGGFGRGFKRRWVQVGPKQSWRWALYGTGQYGTGANMAYRRDVFDQIGYFDPALDVGTVTNGGGDLEMFFRVIKEGHTLVYEPNAIIRHRHRRKYKNLRTQLTNNGISLYSYFVRSALPYPD
jgi:GT2 family glycosyltransferase